MLTISRHVTLLLLLTHQTTALKAPKAPDNVFATSLRDAGKRQIRALTTDLQNNNMPPTWTLAEMQAPISGLSGALFALPALCTPYPEEQALWIVQALVSVLADYVYIGGPSPAHGVDRVLASVNFLRLAFLLGQKTPELFALGLVPAGLFVYAQNMKDEDKPEAWQLAHGLWHVSGAAVACAGTYACVS